MNEFVVNESYALMGSSTVIRHASHLASKLAEGSPAILIIGEAGTGKDVVAKIIHQKSPFKDHEFVQVKCSAVQEGSLVPGNSGTPKTLFFDEVDKLSLRLQEDLLKLISENKDSTASVRIICATSTDLEKLTQQREFREDLLFSLSSIVYLPPLRERREDILILADHFIQKFNQIHSKKIQGLSGDVIAVLLHHSWPHNILELENLIERIAMSKNGTQIEISDLPPRLRNLITTNIDDFYKEKPNLNNSSAPESTFNEKLPQADSHISTAGRNIHIPTSNYNNYSLSQFSEKQISTKNGSRMPGVHVEYSNAVQNPTLFNEGSSIIDRFVKREIDLGSGIDFYKIVEEFENRLIFEALRRTNQNKNRAAQLLSMNRTTLVEKLKKRATTSFLKTETKRSTRNPAFTIFDELGNNNDIDSQISDLIKNNREPESNA